MDEASYIEGARSARLDLLSHILTDLGIDDVENGKTRWIMERQETVAKLRKLCKDHGDNEWSDEMYLPDVLEKHLYSKI